MLSKDPKYSLVFPPDRMKLSIEIERMNTKTRYNEKAKFKKKQKKDNFARITDKEGHPIDWSKNKLEHKDSSSP